MTMNNLCVLLSRSGKKTRNERGNNISNFVRPFLAIVHLQVRVMPVHGVLVSRHRVGDISCKVSSFVYSTTASHLFIISNNITSFTRRVSEETD